MHPIVGIQQMVLLSCLLAQLLMPSGLSALACALAIGASSMLSLVFAYLGRVTFSLSLLAPLIAYELTIPTILPGYRMITILLVSFAVSVVLVARKRRLTGEFVIFAVAAAISGLRFVLDGYSSGEATWFIRMLTIGFLFAYVAGWRPTISEISPIIASTALACGGVSLISLVNAMHVWGLPPSELISSSFRLANVDGLGPNTFALTCGVGVFANHFAYISLLGRIRNLFLLVGFLCLVGLVLSKGLGALIPLVVVSLVLMLRIQRTLFGVLTYISFVSLSTVVIGIMVVEFDAFSFETRDFGGVSGRDLAWSHSIDLIKNNLFFGASLHQFGFAAPIISYVNSLGEVQEVYMTPHNFFVENFVYYGVFLGGAISAIVLGRVLRHSYMLVRGERHFASIAALPVFGFAVHMTIDQWGSLFYWILVLSSVLVWGAKSE